MYNTITVYDGNGREYTTMHVDSSKNACDISIAITNALRKLALQKCRACNKYKDEIAVEDNGSCVTCERIRLKRHKLQKCLFCGTESKVVVADYYCSASCKQKADELITNLSKGQNHGCKSS